MSFLTTVPDFVAAAATDVAGIGSALGESAAAAATSTTMLLPAGADEISAAIAGLFGAHGQAFQALSAQAAQFHTQFVQALQSGAAAYAGAEAANVSPLQALGAAAAGPGRQLEQMQLDFNSNLVINELAFNEALLTNELALEKSVFGTDSALNGALNRLFNANNLLVGTGEQALNAIVGTSTPSTFWTGLLTGTAQQTFNGGQTVGLLGAIDQSLMVPVDLAGLALGNTSPTAAAMSGLSALGTAAPLTPFQQLEQWELGVESNLESNEVGFDHALLTNELAFEKSDFGTDSALNGALNRLFNINNLLVGTGEQALNLVVGAPTPPDLTGGLLLGTGQQAYNSGEIGGVGGILGQTLMLGLDAAGLFTGA